jgi:DNA-binding transcriptional ArsR family regulator
MVITRQPQLNRVFHALADPTRRRILEKLARHDQAVMELARQFAISQPAVTKHLHVLERARLITRRKKGRLRYCRIQPGALQISLDWIERCRRFWNDRLDGLEEFLAESSRAEGSRDVRQ